MLNALLCMLAIVGTTADELPDSASEVPLVTTLRVSGRPEIYTSGNLLIAVSANKLRYWKWDHLEAEPQSTPVLSEDAVMLGDGMVAEEVRLGLPHEMLEAARKREEERKRRGGEDAGTKRATESGEKDLPSSITSDKWLREWAEREDRTVAQMKYLQEMKKVGGKGFVLRTASGNEFLSIDCGSDKGWYAWALTPSLDGKTLAVWQYQSTITKGSMGWGIRVGILDRSNHLVRWSATTKGDAEKNHDDPQVTGLKTRLTDDGKRFLLFGSSGKGGWICLVDIVKKAVLWEHCGVAGTMDFSSGGLSPDGKRVYVSDREGWLFCFDGETGEQLPIGSAALRGTYVGVSPDGQLLAVAPGDDARDLLIYEAKSGVVLRYASLPGPFSTVAFSPDGKSLAVSCERGISIYDLTPSTNGKRRAARGGLDAQSEAPVTAVIELPLLGGPGYPYLETSGSFLAARLTEEAELRFWDWSNPQTPPRITRLYSGSSALLGSGMIAEYVQLGLPHEWLRQLQEKRKNRASAETTKREKSPATPSAKEEGNDDDEAGYQRAAEEEDRIVATTKYLQAIKHAGGRGLVIRSVSGTEYTLIDCGKDRQSPADQIDVGSALGILQSSSGRVLAVHRHIGATSDDISVEAGIVDQGARAVRWIATTELMKKNGDVALHSDTAVSDDGKRVALFGGIAQKGGWVCVMDATKRAVLWQKRGIEKTGCFSRGAISPDGKSVYAADELGGVYRFDGDTGKQLARWDITGSILLSLDGKLLVVLSGGHRSRVSVYDSHTGKLLHYASPRNPHFDAAISPDNKFLAIGTNNAISLHDLTATRRIGHGNQPLEKRPAGSRSASSQSPKLPETLSGHIGWVHCVAYSPDGRTLASGSTDNTVKLWDVATGRSLATLKGHAGAVKCVAFSRDGKILASASDDRTIKLWDTASGKVVATLDGHTAPVWSVAFSPDKKSLASASEDMTIKLWELATCKNTATLKGHSAHVMSVAYSPDGKRLASGCWDGKITMWDVTTGNNTATLEGHYGGNGGVPCVTFSPDGKTLASAGFEGSVRLWDVASGKNTTTFERGIFHVVFSVAFSPDGKTLASGGASGTVNLWNLATGRNVAALTGHTEGVHCVAFSPDGAKLASGSYDRTIRLWEIRRAKEASR